MKFEYANAVAFIGTDDAIHFGVITEITTRTASLKTSITTITVKDVANREHIVIAEQGLEVLPDGGRYTQFDKMVLDCPAAKWAREESERMNNPPENKPPAPTAQLDDQPL